MAKKNTAAQEGNAAARETKDFVRVLDNTLLSWIDQANQWLGKFKLSLDRIVAAMFSSLMLSYVYQLTQNGEYGSLQEYVNRINYVMFIPIAVIAFVVLILLTSQMKWEPLIPWSLLVFSLAVTILWAMTYSLPADDANFFKTNAAYFMIGVGVYDVVLAIWLGQGDKLGISGLRISRRAALIAAGVLFVASTVAFGYFTSLKYEAYNTFTFDFGIFTQMFERMAETGLPYTTVERSYMMLHYGVHFSPFFYVFLPGYYIFRSPIYLFYVQAAGIAAGVFAVWLLAGKLGLSGKLTLALETLYIFYPCLFYGSFYDFHENKFLTPLILFLFYFIISKKPVGIFGFSLLLLTVKEDAAIYLMVIAVFVMINRKEIFTGVAMLMMAIVYFVLAQQAVAHYGVEGVMMDRLKEYFINGDKSFGSIIKAVFYDLGYAIRQMFTAEKFPFVVWMFAPVLFTPFMTKKISSLVLLLPILPINLMQYRSEQFDVYYQYTYGVAALIFISAVFVIVKLSPEKRRVVLTAALCLTMAMSVMLNAPKIKTVTKNIDQFKNSYDQVDAVLDQIPDDATVTASDAFVPHLYRIKWLFTAPDYYKKNWEKSPVKPYNADYVVIDTRYKNNEKRGVYLKELMGSNYTLIAKGGFAELYERKIKVAVTEVEVTE